MTIETDKQKLPNDIDSLKDYSIKIGKELSESVRKISYLEEQINLLRSEIYSRKSEKSQKVDLTLNLFDQGDYGIEKENKKPVKEITIKEHKREYTGRKGIDPNIPADEIKIHDLKEDEKKCSCCGKDLKSIGFDTSKQYDIIPQKKRVIEHHIMKYGPCGCEKSLLKEEPEIKSAKMPERIIPGSMLTEGALAYIMVSKFVDGIPFYRQVKSLRRHGIYLTRQMMTDNAISIYNASKGLLSVMLEGISHSMLINMDETPMKVVMEDGKGVNAKCYMWVMIGKNIENKQLVYFHYDPSRSSKIPDELLKDYKGYLQTDALKSYNNAGNAEGINHVGCNAHARREFDRAFKANKYSKNARIGLAFYRIIYHTEKTLREKLKNGIISESKFEDERKEVVGKIFKKFKKWLLKIQSNVLPESAVGKAVNYTLNEWDKLIRYLDKWYMTPDNNAAENAIRPFVVGRKNWLFAYSSDGARANAAFYTFSETARINNLNSYYYIRYILKKLPSAKTREDLIKLLPFNLTDEEIMKD